MKKLFLILFVCLLTTAASAQSIQLFHDGQRVNNGEEVTMNYVPGTTTHLYMEFANVTDEDVYLRVRRENISFPEGDALTFCVGGSCSQTLSGEFMVMSDDTISLEDSAMVFHADYTAAIPHVLGSSRVKFTFFNTDDEEDAVSFILVAIPSEVGISQYESVCQVSAYPNPATTMVNVRYNVGHGSDNHLVIRNLVGSEVYREAVYGEGKTVVATSNMAPGIYVYGIEQNGRMQSVRKLVVK